MTNYIVKEVSNGLAHVVYEDDSWAQIPLTEGITKEAFEEAVIAFGPKKTTTANVDFITVGAVSQAIVQPKDDTPTQTDHGEPLGTAEEMARYERNQKLAGCDFYALNDVVMPEEVRVYRQTLRDLPTDPEVWKPELILDPTYGWTLVGVKWPDDTCAI